MREFDQSQFVGKYTLRADRDRVVQLLDVDTDVGRNPDLYKDKVDAKSRHLFPQLLFSCKLNPQTVFFAGYSDNRTGTDSEDLTQRDRTFFTKIGCA